MGRVKRNDDYEYGYDHLHEQKKPADSMEDDEGPVENEEQDEAEFDETELEIGQDDYGDDEPDDNGIKKASLPLSVSCGRSMSNLPNRLIWNSRKARTGY